MHAPYASAAIETAGLGKRYGTMVAVRELTIRVERGSTFGLLGANGAGKTTALKMLLGLVRPSQGIAAVLGSPAGDRATRRRIGYLPELFRFPEWASAHEVLAFHCALIGIDRGERRREIQHCLAAVGLAERAGGRIATYSKGMQQRLGLAVALLGAPELVFLDEPTSALDPAGRFDVRELVRALHSRGVTVVLNSHVLTEVELLCDRIAIVRDGTVVASGTRADIVGSESGVRIRALAGRAPVRATLARFGDVVDEDGGAFVRGVAADRIPDVVDALVSSGSRVQRVEPVTPTLEERFLEITRAS